MTKKINFRQIPVKNIEGDEQTVSLSDLLGNQLYMNGQNIEECELGKKIYFAEGEIELDEKEVDIVLQFTQTLYSYIIRTALTDILKG
jgi:hypothetical protein